MLPSELEREQAKERETIERRLSRLSLALSTRRSHGSLTAFPRRRSYVRRPLTPQYGLPVTFLTADEASRLHLTFSHQTC